jgi:hypothetical protein
LSLIRLRRKTESSSPQARSPELTPPAAHATSRGPLNSTGRHSTKKEKLNASPVTGTGLPTYGTEVLMNVINEAGAMPTRNFQEAQFEGADNISGETLAGAWAKNGWARRPPQKRRPRLEPSPTKPALRAQLRVAG